jgi:hypothetical protein
LEDGVEAKESNYFYNFDVPLFSFTAWKFRKLFHFKVIDRCLRESLAVKQT